MGLIVGVKGCKMHLGLDVRTIGRAEKPLQCMVTRELTPVDLAMLVVERGVKPKPIQKIRDSHHAVARLIAEGKSGIEIQLATGVTASRVSILKNDPAFADLVSFYRSKVAELRDKAFYEISAKLAALGSDGIDELLDRLTEEPEKLATDELIDIVKLAADRTGHGPQTKSTNLNVNVDLAARVAAGRQRLARLSERTLPGKAEGEMTTVSTPEASPPLSPVIDSYVVRDIKDE